MTTTETINGQPIKIKWEFKEEMDSLTEFLSNHRLHGLGSDGKKYRATVIADWRNPIESHSETVENIEEM